MDGEGFKITNHVLTLYHKKLYTTVCLFLRDTVYVTFDSLYLAAYWSSFITHQFNNLTNFANLVKIAQANVFNAD